jgi:hypothetical protein
MSEPAIEEVCGDDGGHNDPELQRQTLVRAIATASQTELVALWQTTSGQWGDDASRIWQEALAASDTSET